MRKIDGLQKGMGIGGWLTNYKRFNVLPKHMRLDITVGDMEHFQSYITERDIAYIASLGMDHIRLGFDQIVVEEQPYRYRQKIVDILHDFAKNSFYPHFENYCFRKILLNWLRHLGIL